MELSKDDLISRAAACNAISKMIHEYRENGEDAVADGMILAMRYGIKQMPAVDAVPVVHGQWEPTTHGFPPEPTTVCSNCGLDIDYEICKRIKADSFSYTSIRPSYCPHCGAKMDGEQSESDEQE